MLELLAEWLPLLLAMRARAMRDRTHVALELRATQRVVATTYLSVACNARVPLPDSVVGSLANLVELDWLELDQIPPTCAPHANVRSRVRIVIENREHARRLERLYAEAAKLQASLDAMARAAVLKP